MIRKSFLLFLAVITLLTTSCLKTGYLKYDGKKNEIIASQKIKEFMQKNPSPSIVLRVPKAELLSTQADPNGYIYSAIEKELMIAGFNVKDRGLFNEIVGKASGITYQELKKLTGTDLILELVRADLAVEHETNRIYSKLNEEVVFKNAKIVRNGAAIEFKITIIENNDYGGSYSFYYTPCPKSENNDCSCQIGYKGSKVYTNLNLCKDENYDGYEKIDKDILEEFVREGVKKVIAEIRRSNLI